MKRGFIRFLNQAFGLEATTVIKNPITAIIKKDILKLVAPATIPMRGGPIKKPRKPIVETADKPTPGDNFLDFPAALYTIGTTDETPAPTNKKPIIAVYICGKITAITRPLAVRIPLTCKIIIVPYLVVK